MVCAQSPSSINRVVALVLRSPVLKSLDSLICVTASTDPLYLPCPPVLSPRLAPAYCELCVQ